MSTRQEQVIWAAGFLDGEGCFTIQRTARKTDSYAYFQPLLDAAQIDARPLRVLAELFGGKVALRMRGDRGYYFWRLYGKSCAVAVEDLLPYLRVKRERAELLLELFALKGRQSVWIADAAYQRRLDLWIQIRQLNAGHSPRRAERLSEVALRQAEDDATVRSHGNRNRERLAEMTSPSEHVQ